MDYLDLAVLQTKYLPRLENLMTRVMTFEITVEDLFKTVGELFYKHFVPIINEIPPEKIEQITPEMEEILDNVVGKEIIVEIEGVNILKARIGRYPNFVDVVSITKEQAKHAGLPGIKINAGDIASQFFQGIDGIALLFNTGKIKAYDVELFAEWVGGAISVLRFMSDSIKLLDGEQVNDLQVALIEAIDELLDEYGV